MKIWASKIDIAKDHNRRIRFYSTQIKEYVVGTLVAYAGQEDSKQNHAIVVRGDDGVDRTFHVYKYHEVQFVDGVDTKPLDFSVEELVLLHRARPRDIKNNLEEAVWDKIERRLGL